MLVLQTNMGTNSNDAQDAGRATALIPGSYERDTLTHRQLGSMGVSPSAAMPAGSCLMDAVTVAERQREGGGAPSERRGKSPSPQATVPLKDAAPNRSWLTGGYLWLQLLRLGRR
jgi:hypothetical protein